jgi:mono/diheme cytochrome c family protein
MNPQRLDTLVGKILRIVPDLREHASTSTLSENGRYRIPSDNPFATLEGARKEIWAYGLRNPHRLAWFVDPARANAPQLLAFNIGLVTWETAVIVKKGANYGYPLREGTNMMSSTNGIGPIPDDDTIPVQVSDTVTRGSVKPTYPVVQYRHAAEGGDAIASGFVYRGSHVPALKGKLVFGDITTGRVWYAEIADVLAADDGAATTVAGIHEMEAGLRRLTEDAYRARGGKGQTLPGTAAVSGRGRVDMRFAADDAGELYVLTKSDGMIRKVVGVRATTSPAVVASAPAPQASDRESTAVGKKAYDTYCAACHGNLGQGAVKAGTALSIIEEQGKRQAPDLTDAEWDHGSTDDDIHAAIKKGVSSTMMPGFDGLLRDDDIRSIVGYLRTLAPSRDK